MSVNRPKIVAANWKMNLLPSDAMDLVAQYDFKFGEDAAEVVLFPPFTHISMMKAALQLGFKLGAQNCSLEQMGAFTGEIAVEMLTDLNCSHVLVGHSEARSRNSHENGWVSKKIRRALDAGLHVVYCCGESLETRLREAEYTWVGNQLSGDLSLVPAGELGQLIIAYEPIWAIGTGKNASPEQAQEMHVFIRKKMSELYGQVSAEIPILYGGSVSSANALTLAEMPDIDGVLVGGSSLKPIEFRMIFEAFRGLSEQ
ncbi:MAG: triose-phosphate isomerase [Saprospiraceae bacterium]|nr:triose-phosphate isomerase [Saprospiraceae bacterium]